MGKYTPGPWTVDKDLLVYCKTDYLITCDITERSYGLVASLSVMNEDSLCNAQLISAAPDLYETLKIILEYPYGDASPLEDPLVIERARAAIRKAEGE